jgi:hypothetical protein
MMEVLSLVMDVINSVMWKVDIIVATPLMLLAGPASQHALSSNRLLLNTCMLSVS